VTARIAIAGAIWSASILLSRLVGLVREAVIGRTLGAGAEADIYWSAFVLPDFLNYLLAGGALSIVFIPIFAAHLARGDEERARIAFDTVASFLALLLFVATAAAWIAAPRLAALVAPGFSPEQQRELVTLTRIVLPAQIFHVLGGLYSAALQARDRHAVPALAPLVYTLGVVAGGLIGGREAGAHGFAWGVLAGSVAGPFAIPLFACLRDRVRWRWRFAPRDRDLRAYLVRSLPIMLGFSIVVVDDWYLRREGSLLGAGAVSALSYAKTLIKVPIGVFGLAAGVAAFPTLARLAAEDRRAELAATLGAALKPTLLLACAAHAALAVAGEDVIALVYGRRLLDARAIAGIAEALRWAALGLGAWAVQPLLARGFYALGNTWLPALLGTLVAALAYPLYVALREGDGTRGLALASSIAISAYVAALALLLARRLGARARVPAAASYVARAAIAVALAILAGDALELAWPPVHGPFGLAARGLVLGSASGVFTLGLARTLGLREATSLVRPIARRLGLRAPLRA
jgi:putative peptidoglycan lipid II flippase